MQGSGGSLTLSGSGGNAAVGVLAGSHSLEVPLVLASSASFDVAAAAGLTVQGGISGTGGLVKDGLGALTLAGSNSYSGGTIIHFGTLDVSSGGAIVHGNANVTVGELAGDSGAFSLAGGSVTDLNAYIGSSAGSVGAAEVSGGSWDNAERLYVGFSGTGSLEVSGGSLTDKIGALGWTAGSVGDASVSGGSWANSSNFYVGYRGEGNLLLNGGTISSVNSALGRWAGSLGNATVSSGTWANGGLFNVGYSGTGTLTMTGGLVAVGGTLSQGTYGTINLNSGGTLQIGTGGTDGVLGVSTLANNGTLIFNRSNASTYSGSLSGSGAVVKNGAGTLTLSGSNSYSGSTTVSAGELKVNGSTGTGAMTIASGAMLSGTGTIGGNTTIHGGHTLGDPVGTQTISGDLTYSLEQGKASGPSVYWDLLADMSADSGSFGNVQLAGDLNFSSTTAFEMAFNGPGSTVDWSSAFWATNEQWTVYSVSGSLTNFANLVMTASDWLDGDGKAFSAYLSGASFRLTQTGNNVVLKYSRSSAPVPEVDPNSFGSALALLLGSLGLVERFARRRLGRMTAA